MSNEHLKNSQRVCGECTACCEGHLTGTAYNMDFFPGKPCHFLGEKGCTIYKHRPHNPCVSFRCAWLDDDRSVFPEWMRPDKSGVIIQTLNWKENKQYINITECGKKIESEILNWFFNFTIASRIPIAIQINRGWNFYGSEEFIKHMTGKESYQGKQILDYQII
jgi:hypothetical protein